MKEYVTTIGLEIHVQLKTKSKMFCRTSAEYFGSKPNTHTCPVCLGLPGALPTVNKEVISAATRFALGLNCEISPKSKFDRKNYFYPDLPKGYQVSQFDLPIGINGWLEVAGRKIRINRAHQEEDTGKLIHARVDGRQVSLIDFNRCGVPLMEVVSEPDIDSPALAKSYAKAVHQIARYLEVSEANMEKAGMRFDANVSIRKKGTEKLGEKVEVKNINSFRFLERALAYEIERQIKILESRGKVIQETRGWVESKAVTISQRTKETSPDYRYFPDPDLPALIFDEDTVKNIKENLPELPKSKLARFISEYTLDKKTVQIIIEDKYIAQWFEKALSVYAKHDKNRRGKAKKLANWVVGELLRKLREKSLTIQSVPIEPAGLVELLTALEKEEINQTTAKLVFGRMFDTGKSAARIIKEESLLQVSKHEDIERIVKQIIRENKKAVEDFGEGKETSIGFLIGQVMRQTKGRANPRIVSDLLRKNLSYGNRNQG